MGSNEKEPPYQGDIMPEAILDEMTADATQRMYEELVPSSEEIAARRLLKRFGIKFVATVAVMTATIIIINRFDNYETPEED